MNILRPNLQRAKVTVAIIWLILALQILFLIFSIFQFYLIETIENGEYVSESIALIADFGVSSIAVMLTIASIISIVTFIMWFRRAYYNIATITQGTEYSNGWAAGAWFVPIMNLFVPYKIMRELYVKTDEYLTLEDGYINDKRLKTHYIGWWWALWIISGIVGRLYLRMEWHSDELVSFLSLIDSGFSIILCIITIIVINDYSEAESLLYEAIQDKEDNDDNNENIV